MTRVEQARVSYQAITEQIEQWAVPNKAFAREQDQYQAIADYAHEMAKLFERLSAEARIISEPELYDYEELS